MADAGGRANSKLKAFISYSRKDEDFALDLLAGLRVAGFEPYLDKHDIAVGEPWEARLGHLIEAADTVVFVISPDSVTSDRCAWEVERTEDLKKRLLPIIWRPVPEEQVPLRLKRLNYIFFDQRLSFGASLEALATALKTDIEWVREHTRIGEAALRWDMRERAEALLLRGEELAAAAGATSLLRVFPLPEGEPEGDLPEGRFVLACPFAGWGAKQWPLEYFAEVARGLDIPLVLNGPPSSAAALARTGARVHSSGIRGLIYATRRTSAVIGLDSGPLHLAAALSKPGVAIYGPSDPAVHGPYGGSIRVLRATGAATTQKRRSEDPSMLAIKPDAVLEALHYVLKRDYPIMQAGSTA